MSMIEKDAAAWAHVEPINEDRLWREGEWTAKVVKNEDDDGWAVEMIRHGQQEPSLVGPWTMGRDKKNPKPLDPSAFHTLVKTVNEFVGRLEQQRAAQLRRTLDVGMGNEKITVVFEVDPDEDDPSATLSAFDWLGEPLAKVNAPLSFKLSPTSAKSWIEKDYPSLSTD